MAKGASRPGSWDGRECVRRGQLDGADAPGGPSAPAGGPNAGSILLIFFLFFPPPKKFLKIFQGKNIY